MIKFVGIGGGTGLPVLLRGLKELSKSFGRRPNASAFDLSAIVSVSDNGGSTGRLRQSLDIPAVGDLRNCLVALSESDEVLPNLFQYRFPGGDGLQGHSMGNLIVSALFQMSGSLGEAVELASEVLRTRGTVLPVTEAAATLCGELVSGKIIRGESQIAAARSIIKKVWMDPGNCPPFRGVLETLACADVIVLGPGSLYTSLIPNLLIADVASAVRNSPALKIFVCNLMTEPGETGRFTAADHLKVLEMYLGTGVVDICVLNSQPLKQSAERLYLESESEPVRWNEREITRLGAVPVIAELAAEDQAHIRHDPMKLARLILSLTEETRATDTRFPHESLIPNATVTPAQFPSIA